MDEQANKKRRLSSPGGTAPLEQDPTAALLPQVDEEHPAPPASGSGAHSKPLPALFGTGSFAKGKGKGKADSEKEGFESILARLQEGSEFQASLGVLEGLL